MDTPKGKRMYDRGERKRLLGACIEVAESTGCRNGARLHAVRIARELLEELAVMPMIQTEAVPTALERAEARARKEGARIRYESMRDERNAVAEVLGCGRGELLTDAACRVRDTLAEKEARISTLVEELAQARKKVLAHCQAERHAHERAEAAERERDAWEHRARVVDGTKPATDSALDRVPSLREINARGGQ